MSETLLASVLRALDVTVFERMADGKFRTLGTAPEWLEVALDVTPPDPADDTTGTLPFLEHFMPQAQVAWHERQGARADSGPFAVQIAGEEALMRATAITVDRRSLLVIERLIGENDTRPILQLAREQMLAAEQLTRQAASVHAPTAAVGRSVARLVAADLPPDLRAIVDTLEAAFGQLQATTAPLPQPPPGRRRTLSKANPSHDRKVV